MSALSELLPELQAWNNGRGIQPLDWLYCENVPSERVTAMSELFWPSFVVFEDYVLRDGFTQKHLRACEGGEGATRSAVEAMVNTLHIDDLFGKENWSPLVEARAVRLVNVLGQVHRLKLADEFPERRFKVEVFDGSQPGGDVSLSFWQV